MSKSNEIYDVYSLDELIKLLEKIKNEGEGDINFLKALYTLAIEIESMQEILWESDD